jgi:outer membrane cobalamin receptor
LYQISSSVFLAAVLCPGPAAHAEETLQEIVVTSQKRAQSIQDVPVSVTALTSDALVGNRVQNVTDLNALAPNLQVRTSQGGGSLPIIIMRGELAVGGSPGISTASISAMPSHPSSTWRISSGSKC